MWEVRYGILCLGSDPIYDRREESRKLRRSESGGVSAVMYRSVIIINWLFCAFIRDIRIIEGRDVTSYLRMEVHLQIIVMRL